MKNVFTTVFFCVFSFINIVLSQDVRYSHVLYRVNCGGIRLASQDTSSVEWGVDNLANPNAYIDINTAGNKTFGTFDDVTMHSSVPAYVPKYVFQIERDLDNKAADSLEYHFPVPYGKKVEVRLYFSEIYFDKVNSRVFDIYVEDQLKLKDFDIYYEVGKNVGVMKSYVATSDGTLNIYFKRGIQLPKINGIEIIEIDEVKVVDKFLVRLNAGGVSNNPNDGKIDWSRDDVHLPSPYVDTLLVGNKTYIVTDPISIDGSVPSTTPVGVFESERVLGRWDVKDLIYNIPVPNGMTVEVRLFFAELFYDNSGVRVMDIYIEDKLFADNYDIFSDVGKFRGVMKNFLVLSDGMITVRLSRVAQQPKINAIEILESDQIIAGIFSSAIEETTIRAFPNPFTNEFNIDLSKVNDYESSNVFDAFGRIINSTIITTDNGLKVNLENQPKGVYYIKVLNKENDSQTIKVVKL